MKRTVAFALTLAAAVLPAYAAKPVKSQSDLQPPELRRAAVERADRLARPVARPALPEDIASPFSPAGFDRPDGADAARANARASAADAKAAAPLADRDLLAAVAAKIPTTGTISIGGKPLLISGTNRIEAGSRFTVVYNGQEYELELTAIDRTSFTVRYKGEEYTRPIKLGRSP